MKRLFALGRLMRPHQWIKNGFVFTGLLFAHRWNEPDMLWRVVLAAAAFCLVSSAVYVLNDIADRERDRSHPTKCRRPVASGEIPVAMALGFWIILLAGGMGLGVLAGFDVVPILLVYFFLNLAYSLRLKQVVILDVFIIAAGFMLRILAGTLGVGIPPSQWLLLTGLMLTLFLGFAKRRAELIETGDSDKAQREVLAHYSPPLLDKMIGITATGTIMSYGLYTVSPETVQIQGTANLIYTVPFVMYGIFRYIYLLHGQGRGQDTARDLLRDPHILVTVLLWLVTVVWLIKS